MSDRCECVERAYWEEAAIGIGMSASEVMAERERERFLNVRNAHTEKVSTGNSETLKETVLVIMTGIWNSRS